MSHDFNNTGRGKLVPRHNVQPAGGKTTNLSPPLRGGQDCVPTTLPSSAPTAHSPAVLTELARRAAAKIASQKLGTRRPAGTARPKPLPKPSGPVAVPVPGTAVLGYKPGEMYSYCQVSQPPDGPLRIVNVSKAAFDAQTTDVAKGACKHAVGPPFIARPRLEPSFSKLTKRLEPLTDERGGPPGTISTMDKTGTDRWPAPPLPAIPADAESPPGSRPWVGQQAIANAKPRKTAEWRLRTLAANSRGKARSDATRALQRLRAQGRYTARGVDSAGRPVMRFFKPGPMRPDGCRAPDVVWKVRQLEVDAPPTPAHPSLAEFARVTEELRRARAALQAQARAQRAAAAYRPPAASQGGGGGAPAPGVPVHMQRQSSGGAGALMRLALFSSFLAGSDALPMPELSHGARLCAQWLFNPEMVFQSLAGQFGDHFVAPYLHSRFAWIAAGVIAASATCLIAALVYEVFVGFRGSTAFPYMRSSAGRGRACNAAFAALGTSVGVFVLLALGAPALFTLIAIPVLTFFAILEHGWVMAQDQVGEMVRFGAYVTPHRHQHALLEAYLAGRARALEQAGLPADDRIDRGVWDMARFMAAGPAVGYRVYAEPALPGRVALRADIAPAAPPAENPDADMPPRVPVGLPVPQHVPPPDLMLDGDVEPNPGPEPFPGASAAWLGATLRIILRLALGALVSWAVLWAFGVYDHCRAFACRTIHWLYWRWRSTRLPAFIDARARTFSTSTRLHPTRSLTDTLAAVLSSNERSIFESLRCGHPTVHTSLSFHGMQAGQSGVSFVRDGQHCNVVGAEQFLGQSARVWCPSLSHSPVVHSCGLTRHIRARRIFPTWLFSGVFEVNVLEPGPLHVCNPTCPDFRPGASLFSADQPTQRYGRVLVYATATQYHFGNANGVTSHAVPRDIVCSALVRWHTMGSKTQFGGLMQAFGDHKEAAVLCMEAVQAGFTIADETLPRPGNHEFLLTSTDGWTPDTAQRIVSVHGAVLSDSKVVAGNGIEALHHAIHTRNRLPAQDTPVTADVACHMTAFAHLLFPDRLVPYPFEEVERTLTRPVQKSDLAAMGATFDIERSRASYFNKSEEVKAERDARIICAFKGPQNFSLSAYTKPLQEHLSHFPFWCPGKTAPVIQSAVHDLHRIAAEIGVGVVDGDYSSFDGTTGAAGHALEFAVFQAAFGVDPFWPSLLRFSANPVAGSNVGLRAHTGIGTLSGHADTTIRNTLLAAFIIFLTAVRAGYSYVMAFALVMASLFSGDDSLTRIIPEATQSAVEVAASLGLKLEVRVYHAGPGRFLGRFYPNPYIAPCCIADVPRFLRKFHLVRQIQGFTLEASMAQAAFGRLINDPDTPLLSTYCKSVLSTFPSEELDPRFFDSWKYAQLTEGGIYTCKQFTYEELFVSIADDLGVPWEVLRELDQAFRDIPAAPGVDYPPISHLRYRARPGLVVSGVLLEPPTKRPNIELDAVRVRLLSHLVKSAVAKVQAAAAASEVSSVSDDACQSCSQRPCTCGAPEPEVSVTGDEACHDMEMMMMGGGATRDGTSPRERRATRGRGPRAPRVTNYAPGVTVIGSRRRGRGRGGVSH